MTVKRREKNMHDTKYEPYHSIAMNVWSISGGATTQATGIGSSCLDIGSSFNRVSKCFSHSDNIEPVRFLERVCKSLIRNKSTQIIVHDGNFRLASWFREAENVTIE